MPAADVVRARIEPEVKTAASTVLAAMGLSMSDAIRMMLVRVATERALPFEVREPNAKTVRALREAEEGDVATFHSVDALLADLND